MTGLLIPKHVAASLAANNRKTTTQTGAEPTPNRVGGYEAARHSIFTDDFLTREQIAEQAAAFVDHCAGGGVVPTPAGWRIAVLVLTIPEMTSGGVHILDENRDARSLASPQGLVVSLGKDAYQDASRFPNKHAWVEIGDRVMFQKYGGRMFQIRNGQHIAILNDTDIAGVIDGGWLDVEKSA